MGLKRAAFGVKAATVRASAGRFFAELQRNAHLDPDELRALQARKSVALVRHAMANSPFYRDLYGSIGLEPDDLLDPAQWERVPILDRAAVKADADSFIAEGTAPRDMRDALTGGSTGEPLRTRHDARVPSLAFSWRMYSWWGIAPYDNLARIGRWSFGRRDALKNDLAWWPTRQVVLDAAFISAASMEEFHRRIAATRPRLIEGYVGAMLEFADFVESRRLPLPPLEAIATTAAPLPATTRARLQDVFAAPVYDEYRGSEVGWMAGECREQNGLHIFADYRRLEAIGEDGRPVRDGQVGDLVITDLGNRAFPLIRYRLGDRGAIRSDRCACGVTLTLMDPPEGRTTDVIRLPSGAAMVHRLMGMFSGDPDAVRLFQIHQLADYSITIRVVLGPGADSKRSVEHAVQVLRERIADAVPIRIEYVDSLPYTGGKTKYVISEVAHS